MKKHLPGEENINRIAAVKRTTAKIYDTRELPGHKNMTGSIGSETHPIVLRRISKAL